MKQDGNCREDEKPEVWLEVPETNWRYMFSSKGRLLQIGRKQRHGKKMLTVITNAMKELVCDYKTGKIGWYVFIDGQKHFWERDALMKLFGQRSTSISKELDAAAVERRNRKYNENIAGKIQKQLPYEKSESVS